MLSGLLPLSFSFSPTKMRFITTLGVGVLIGTAFNVIIPEGVHTIYTETASHSSTPEVIVSHHPKVNGTLSEMEDHLSTHPDSH